MNFQTLVGNAEAKNFLSRVAKSSLAPQVLLFSGPSGVGKRSFALAYLQELLGEKHAKKVREGIHPDVIWLAPEGKTKMHSIGSIKNMIEQAPLFAFEAERKVYVIEEADRCLPASSNALLKILEEPPSHVSFILLSSHEGAILPTILSRCSKVPFFAISEAALVEALEKKSIDPVVAKQIAALAQGSFSKALALLSDKENPIRVHFLDIIKQFFLHKPSFDQVSALEQLDKLIEKKEGEESNAQVLDLLFEDLLFWVRDLHYQKVEPSTGSLFHASFSLDLLQLQEKGIPSLEKVFLLVEEARLALQRNTKVKVVLERLLSRICFND